MASDRKPRGRGASYPGTLAMLAAALAFPIALMIFNPTLMFERGWEQYVGTTIYFWAVCTLIVELRRLGRDDLALIGADSSLDGVVSGTKPVDPADARVVPSRIRMLSARPEGGSRPSADALMEPNRESSGLDQEHAAGRFTLTRYILYLLPVIGFIGTVEGISKALMNISRVLPMVKDLDGFMSNLTSVTSALQVAFDSTLLALFLSASLMFVLTLVNRHQEDFLGRVDRWVVERALPRLGATTSTTPVAAELAAALAPHLDALRSEIAALGGRLGEGFGPHVVRFAESVDRLPAVMAGLQRGAEAFGRIGSDLDALGTAGDSLRRGVGSLARIEANLANSDGSSEQLDEIRRGVERTCAAIESLSGSWAASFERSSRSTQDQLARTLGSLKDALDMLHVSMDQGNVLYRNIVKKMLPVYNPPADEMAA